MSGTGTRRVITQEQPSEPGQGAGIDGAPRWVSGLLAGVQAALLSLLVVTVPAVAAFVATSADPGNADVDWSAALQVGTGLWLLGHGVPLVTEQAAITLVPLGLTALMVFCCYASARRSARPSRSAWAGAVGGYAAAVLVVLAMAGRFAPGTAAHAVLGAAAVCGGGAAAGILSQSPGAGMAAVVERLRRHLPSPVRRAATGAGVALGCAVAAAAALTCGWVLLGREAIGDLALSLRLDAVGGVVLGVAQLSLVPNLVLWALAWLTGAGFRIGADSLYAPAEVVDAPLPSLPLLGALPPAPVPAAALLGPVLLVACGAVGGWAVHRRLARGPWWHPLLAAGALAALAGLGGAALTAVAGGAVGAGQLAAVGAEPLPVGALLAAWTGLGALVVLAATEPVLHAAVASWWRRGGSALTGRLGRGRAAVTDWAWDVDGHDRAARGRARPQRDARPEHHAGPGRDHPDAAEHGDATVHDGGPEHAAGSERDGADADEHAETPRRDGTDEPASAAPSDR